MNARTRMMMPLQIDFSRSDDASGNVDGFEQLAEKAVRTAVSIAGLNLPPNAELSVLFAGDETLQALNREWRGKDRPTNVLSFPATESPSPAASMPLLGDIAISIETTEREAVLENKKFNDHFMHLVVHGFLHLFGYDHETGEEADRMESLEIRILAELGIPNPYFD